MKYSTFAQAKKLLTSRTLIDKTNDRLQKLKLRDSQRNCLKKKYIHIYICIQTRKISSYRQVWSVCIKKQIVLYD